MRAELVNNKKSKAQGPIDFSESGDFPELSKLDHLTKESISGLSSIVTNSSSNKASFVFRTGPICNGLKDMDNFWALISSQDSTLFSFSFFLL